MMKITEVAIAVRHCGGVRVGVCDSVVNASGTSGQRRASAAGKQRGQARLQAARTTHGPVCRGHTGQPCMQYGMACQTKQ